MTQSKHTPGPWSLDYYGNVISKRRETVSVEGLALSGRSTEETQANARLIAESPTMYDLLLKLQAVRSPCELHNLRCEVAEVLARIEGV